MLIVDPGLGSNPHPAGSTQNNPHQSAPSRTSPGRREAAAACTLRRRLDDAAEADEALPSKAGALGYELYGGAAGVAASLGQLRPTVPPGLNSRTRGLYRVGRSWRGIWCRLPKGARCPYVPHIPRAPPCSLQQDVAQRGAEEARLTAELEGAEARVRVAGTCAHIYGAGEGGLVFFMNTTAPAGIREACPWVELKDGNRLA